MCNSNQVLPSASAVPAFGELCLPCNAILCFPKRSYLDAIREDMEGTGMVEEDAEDRNMCRDLTCCGD